MTFTLRRPSSGPLTSPFGPRPAPLGYHHGIDYGWYTANPDYRIYAAATGTVSQVTRTTTMGRYTMIDHGNGYKTAYAHQSAQFVKVGQKVTAGQHIGTMGADGTAAVGTHLHFELWHNGVRIDPAPYMTTTAGGGTPINTGSENIMRAIREPGGGIALVGETTYQNLTLDQWNTESKVWGGYTQLTLDEYRKAIADTQVRRAYLLAGISGSPASTVDADAIATKVAANIATDLTAMKDQIAQINASLGTPDEIAKAVNDDAAQRLQS